MGRRGSEGETERRLANGWEDVRKPGLAGIYHTLSTRQGWGVLGGQVCLPGAYEEEDMDPSGANTPGGNQGLWGCSLAFTEDD